MVSGVDIKVQESVVIIAAGIILVFMNELLVLILIAYLGIS